jgi:hypothetical protein
LRKITNRIDDLHKAEQVAVLDYKDKDDFVAEVMPRDEKERIVLAKIAPAETVAKTIEAVHSRVAATANAEYKDQLTAGEVFVVPVLNLDLLRRYDELNGHRITTLGPLHGEPTFLCQNICFRLDERGAILKSTSGAAACKEGASPRQLIFDKPFLILLERCGASGKRTPYLALWVDNPELLTR